MNTSSGEAGGPQPNRPERRGSEAVLIVADRPPQPLINARKATTMTDRFQPHILTVTRTVYPPDLPGEDEFVESEGRHLYRLLAQGFELYATGQVRIRLDNPASFLDFGEQVAAGDIDAARRMIGHYEDLFDATRTVLPDRPDERTVEDWLLRVRQAFL